MYFKQEHSSDDTCGSCLEKDREIVGSSGNIWIFWEIKMRGKILKNV